MGLRETFQNAAMAVTNAFGNVAIVATLTISGTPTYDEVLDQTVTPEESYEGIKMFFTPYTSYERAKGAGILPTDIKALIPKKQTAFPEGYKVAPKHRFTVTSSSDDTFRSGDVLHVVGEFEIDPAEALFIVNLRGME